MYALTLVQGFDVSWLFKALVSWTIAELLATVKHDMSSQSGCVFLLYGGADDIKKFKAETSGQTHIKPINFGCSSGFFACSRTCNRMLRQVQNNNLAVCFQNRFITPCIIDWNVLNTLGCAEEIEEVLQIKVYEMGGQKEIFTSEA
ncbi:hypothetical protein Tco_0728443 [Tanacetum coccineum]|uniref:Uncharacterized protein n=1 Tax=Tanacetum coccineum TaxID=301880 RepID=A0ABQ4YNT4_9ASTR